VWNLTIPDDRRGRLAGIELSVGAGGPQIGDLRSGVIGARVGINAAIWSGGAVCLGLTALIAAAARGLWGYEPPVSPSTRTPGPATSTG
jgi:hypothetical protein